jgi:hypothetical protein
MTKETLYKANSINERIEVIERALTKIEYTQHKDVVERVSYLSCTGMEAVTIPKPLFRLIGKLIKCEYLLELKELEKEFSEISAL